MTWGDDIIYFDNNLCVDIKLGPSCMDIAENYKVNFNYTV